MLIFITIVMLNLWAVSADDTLSLLNFGKMRTMERKMQSTEKEMEQLKTEIKDLKTKLDELTNQNQETVKVAFTATLSALLNGHKFIGPYAEATSLVYENTLTNIGNAYNTTTGIFTAPVKGVYYFNIVLFNPHAVATGVRLLKNGNLVVGATDNSPTRHDTDDTASNAVSLLLEPGDKINIQLVENCRVYTDGGRRNTFSGHLLFAL